MDPVNAILRKMIISYACNEYKKTVGNILEEYEFPPAPATTTFSGLLGRGEERNEEDREAASK